MIQNFRISIYPKADAKEKKPVAKKTVEKKSPVKKTEKKAEKTKEAIEF